MAGQMRKLTDQQKIDAVNKYNNSDITVLNLAKEYGISPPSMNSLLRTRGVKIRNFRGYYNVKYTINGNYFEKIDTEDKAYFLGLLYADGYNSEDRGSIQLKLQIADLHILETFNKFLGSNRPIAKVDYYFKKGLGQIQYRLYVNNKKMSKDLAKLGCFQAKSLTLKFPTEEQVPSHLIRHFIRGYFDGDGCICLYKNKNSKKINVSISSSMVFCQKLIEVIRANVDVGGICENHHINTKHNILSGLIAFSGRKQAIRFLDWIYKDAKVFFFRKYNKYKEMKKNTFKYKFTDINGIVYISDNLKKFATSKGIKNAQKLCLDNTVVNRKGWKIEKIYEN